MGAGALEGSRDIPEPSHFDDSGATPAVTFTSLHMSQGIRIASSKIREVGFFTKPAFVC